MMGSKRLWRELSEREQMCFHCLLPECQEDHLGCLFWQYDGDRVERYDWRELWERVEQAGTALEVAFPDSHAAYLARISVLKWGWRGRIAVQAQIERQADGSALLHIVKI